MTFRLFEQVLWQKTTYNRKSDFRVVEKTPTRAVLATRNYGLLAGGVFFFTMGAGVAWLGVSEADDTPTLVVTLVFAGMCSLFGAAIVWASRTQRDTITIDRELGTVRSARAKKRKRLGEDMFTVIERRLDTLVCIELRIGTASALLSLPFKSGSSIDVDYATDIEHLKSLGVALAEVAGVALRER